MFHESEFLAVLCQNETINYYK